MIWYYWHRYKIMIWGDNIQKKGVILGNKILVHGFRGKIGIKNIHNIKHEFWDFWWKFHDFWTTGAIKTKLKKRGKYRRRNFLIGPETLMGTTWRERYIWVQTGESMWQKLVDLCHRLPSTRWSPPHQDATCGNNRWHVANRGWWHVTKWVPPA
jgi:hypothetical protein